MKLQTLRGDKIVFAYSNNGLTIVLFTISPQNSQHHVSLTVVAIRTVDRINKPEDISTAGH